MYELDLLKKENVALYDTIQLLESKVSHALLQQSSSWKGVSNLHRRQKIRQNQNVRLVNEAPWFAEGYGVSIEYVKVIDSDGKCTKLPGPGGDSCTPNSSHTNLSDTDKMCVKKVIQI